MNCLNVTVSYVPQTQNIKYINMITHEDDESWYCYYANKGDIMVGEEYNIYNAMFNIPEDETEKTKRELLMNVYRNELTHISFICRLRRKYITTDVKKYIQTFVSIN